MSDFAIVNLDELEDGDRRPLRGSRGSVRPQALFESRDLGVSRFTYAPGFQRGVGHTHREQEEAYVVVGGSGRVLLDGEAHPLEVERWDVRPGHRAPGCRAGQFEAGAGGLEVICRGRARRPRAATASRVRSAGRTERLGAFGQGPFMNVMTSSRTSSWLVSLKISWRGARVDVLARGRPRIARSPRVGAERGERVLLAVDPQRRQGQRAARR